MDSLVPSDKGIADFDEIHLAWMGKRGQAQKLIAGIGLDWIRTMLAKNTDYGNSVFRQPILAPEASPGIGVRVRMSDKIERLRQLLTSGSPEVAESIEDTFADLGAYCLLELVRRRLEAEGTDL